MPRISIGCKTIHTPTANKTRQSNAQGTNSGSADRHAPWRSRAVVGAVDRGEQTQIEGQNLGTGYPIGHCGTARVGPLGLAETREADIGEESLHRRNDTCVAGGKMESVMREPHGKPERQKCVAVPHKSALPFEVRRGTEKHGTGDKQCRSRCEQRRAAHQGSSEVTQAE